MNFLKNKFVEESLGKQNEDLKREHPGLYSLAIKGKDCDSLFNDRKDFGHSPDNPIPVNGVLGEIKYLNRLRCECGSGLLCHRLYSMNIEKINDPIDIYETVCMEGKHWDILYFHMYHPRRSTWCPSGYKFSKFHPIFSQHAYGFSTDRFDNNFPFGLGQYILLHLGKKEGQSLVRKYKEVVHDKNKFIKPENHIKRISSIIQNETHHIFS